MLPDPAFTDTAGHWANGYLKVARDVGIASGYPDGSFNPNGNITRAELAALIARTFEAPYISSDPPFSDVKYTHWAASYITAVQSVGWIRGYFDSTYQPDKQATRAEAFTVVARVHRQQGGQTMETAVKSLASMSYSLAIQGYLFHALDALGPLATDNPAGLAKNKLTTIRTDIDTAFFGPNRIKDGKALDHQVDLVKEIRTKWTAGQLRTTATLTGLTDLLMALRESAEVELNDVARIIGYQNGVAKTAKPDNIDAKTWSQAVIDYEAAVQSQGRGMASLGMGDAIGAANAYVAAWRQAESIRSSLNLKLATVNDTQDVDKDGVDDKSELLLGMNPLSADSDGDGLTDVYETQCLRIEMWPSKADSDTDGVLDADEDLDGDGLTNRQEQQLGTSACNKDTDGDGLTDADEIKRGTNPLVADSDGDGLKDGEEIRLGVDPLRKDADGDGVPDGQEQLTSRIETKEAVVSITGQGYLVDAVKIQPHHDTLFQQAPAAYSDVVSVTASKPFTTVRVEIPVNTTKLQGKDPGQLRVFYFRKDIQSWVPVEGPQGYDSATGRVWAETNHLTDFSVFHLEEWENGWDDVANNVKQCQVRTEQNSGKPMDVAIAIDASPSMEYNDENNLRLQGARQLIDNLLEDDRAAVLDFGLDVRLLEPLSGNKEALKAAVDQVEIREYTNIDGALAKALAELSGSGEDRGKAIILLTDGEQTTGLFDNTVVGQAIMSGVVIHTIGLSKDADAELLQDIATRTGGRYYAVLSADDLPTAYERIQKSMGLKDSDEDGLSDCDESSGMPDASGRLWYSDPDNPDTDGDGLTDREEMGSFIDPIQSSFQCTVAPHWTVKSAPQTFDSDDDGLDDWAEYEEGTGPREEDTDQDGLNDADELELLTRPTVWDTDGDGMSDGQEVNSNGEYDPLDPEPIQDDAWHKEMIAGLALGDACTASGPTRCGDSIAFLVGQVASGVIPFVGVAADIRDALANLVKREWLSSALSAAGLVPIFGDAAKISDSVVAFIRRTAKFDEALQASLKTVSKLLKGRPGLIKDIVITVLAKLDEVFGKRVYARISDRIGEEALSKLILAGDDLSAVAQLLDNLEATGVAKEYPELISYIGRLIEQTSDEALADGLKTGSVKLNHQVTVSLKHAKLSKGQVPEYIVSHLKACLAEEKLLEVLPTSKTGRVVIPDALRHLNTHGPDAAVISDRIIDIGESKATKALGLSDLRNYIHIKNGEYIFNGDYLVPFLRKAGVNLATEIQQGKKLRFTLFTYAQQPGLTKELRDLFESGKPIKLSLDRLDEPVDVALTWVHKTP